MLIRRLLGPIATVAFVTGVLGAGPARAQAPLGFTIDTVQGYPGDTVNGHVNPTDIAANCNTTIDALEAVFAPIVDTMANDFSFIDMYFPECIVDPNCSVFKSTYDNYEQEAYIAITFTALGIAANFDLGTGPAAEVALPQTFILTFAQIATQQPVGDRSLFDMTTGEGSITVPNIAPGHWAVAAACVEPHIELVPGAITAGAALLQSLGVPLTFPDDGAFVNMLLDSSSNIFLPNLATTLLVPMVSPKALGFQLFTIPQCGNGVVELGEQCDDGNTAGGDCCSATCQYEGSGSACADDGDVCTSDVCDGAGSCTHPIICGDVPIDGRSLSIRRSPSGSEKLVFMSTDPDVPFPAAGGPNDPRIAGATLEVITEGEGTAVFEMPPGNWTANGPATVFKFVNEQAPGGPSTVKVTLLKQGRILKVQARDTGLPLVDPLVRAAARFRVGLTRSCALFEPETVKKDEPDYFLAKKAPAPAVPNCSNNALGFSPSGAFLDPLTD